VTQAGRVSGLAVAGLVVLTGCSGSSSGVVRAPTTTVSIRATPTTSAVTASSAPSSPVPRGRAHPAIRIAPATGLHNGQNVQVHGSGFTPGEALQVVQCAALGNATGPGDCNLSGMQSVSSDASGGVTATLTVVRGPFGANHVVCSTHPGCLVSVTQASLQPSEEADAPITFAR
jgi:neocarzinostatin family protein